MILKANLDKYTHKEPSHDTYYAGLNYENSGFFGQYAGGSVKHLQILKMVIKDGHVQRW